MKTSLGGGGKQFAPSCFEELSILNPCRTHLFARSAAQAAIDVALKRSGSVWQSRFADGAHQVEPAARSIVFITSDDVGRASFQTQAAVNAGKKFLFFTCECGR